MAASSTIRITLHAAGCTCRNVSESAPTARGVYVRAPHEVEVLLRDVLAGDSLRGETISMVEELQGQLGKWLEELRKKQRQAEEAEARQLRNQLRSVEASRGPARRVERRVSLGQEADRSRRKAPR